MSFYVCIDLLHGISFVDFFCKKCPDLLGWNFRCNFDCLTVCFLVGSLSNVGSEKARLDIGSKGLVNMVRQSQMWSEISK